MSYAIVLAVILAASSTHDGYRNSTFAFVSDTCYGEFKHAGREYVWTMRRNGELRFSVLSAYNHNKTRLVPQDQDSILHRYVNKSKLQSLGFSFGESK